MRLYPVSFRFMAESRNAGSSQGPLIWTAQPQWRILPSGKAVAVGSYCSKGSCNPNVNEYQTLEAVRNCTMSRVALPQIQTVIGGVNPDLCI